MKSSVNMRSGVGRLMLTTMLASGLTLGVAAGPALGAGTDDSGVTTAVTTTVTATDEAAVTQEVSAPAGGSSDEASGIDMAALSSLEIMAIANDEAKRHAVAGLVFELHSVAGVDLSTTAGLAAAEELIEDHTLIDDEDKELVATLDATDATGRTWIGDLPVGLYVLSHASGGDEENVAYRPMLFTAPTTDPVDGGWVYDLRIYPKPVPADCGCTDDPDPTQSPEPKPEPGKPGPTAAPTPTIPTGELLASKGAPWALGALLAALAAGAASVALRGGDKGKRSTGR